MNDNWCVVWIRDEGNSVMTVSDGFEESYRDYKHFVRMNPDKHYAIVSEKYLGEYFELVRN